MHDCYLPPDDSEPDYEPPVYRPPVLLLLAGLASWAVMFAILGLAIVWAAYSRP